MKNLFIFMVMLICIATIVLANGAGNYAEKTVEGFSFEFGKEPKEPKANERVIMSLSVHNASTGEAIKIENLWIRISKGNEILFTSNNFRIKADGPMFFGYMFKESGTYTIDFSAKYKGNDVKTSFTVSVKKNVKKTLKSFLIFAIVFVLGYASSSLLNKINEKIKIYKEIKDFQYPLRGFSSIKSISYFLYKHKLFKKLKLKK